MTDPREHLRVVPLASAGGSPNQEKIRELLAEFARVNEAGEFDSIALVGVRRDGSADEITGAVVGQKFSQLLGAFDVLKFRIMARQDNDA